MDPDRFTQKSREALLAAQQEALGRGHQLVSTSHLLAALLEQEQGMAARFIDEAGTDPAALQRELALQLDKLPRISGSGYEGTLQMSAALARVLSRAEQEAKQLKDDYVSVEHLLLGLLEEGEADLKELLRRSGLTRDTLLQAFKALRGSQRVTSDNPEETYEALLRYGRDLTDRKSVV